MYYTHTSVALGLFSVLFTGICCIICCNNKDNNDSTYANAGTDSNSDTDSDSDPDTDTDTDSDTDSDSDSDTDTDTDPDTDANACVTNGINETFATEDAPRDIAISNTSFAVSSPWGYDKSDNSDKRYPLVVNGCWGEGGYFTTEVRQQYPAFFLEYQYCSSEGEGTTLAELVDAALAQGVRIDPNRIYLTGFSKGGSGGYKIIRGFLAGGRLFAGFVRVAGQSESQLPDEVVEKMAIWYHLGLEDTDTRVQVARDAYAFLKDHPLNQKATESETSDNLTGHNRTTWTLTANDMEIVKFSEYEGMGHEPGPAYADSYLFEWLFHQSLACR